MSFRRYEIILPTRHNDGTPVEPEKHYQTAEELVERFGAVSLMPETIHGIWLHQSTRYEEDNLRLVVDVEDTAENKAFFSRFKETLKHRFQQIDLWIVSYEIQIT
jgi:hypothetical protein